MASLDNEPVLLNDLVFDMMYGKGEVVSFDDNAMQVLFANGRKITYDTTGHLNGIRRVYWHNPLIITPPKDETKWNAFLHVIVGVYNFMKGNK